MIRLLLLLAVFGAGAAMAAERREAMPARFAGEWVADLKHCGTGRDDARLRLDADRIRFHESSGPIRAVVARGEFEIALIAELSGEGETWLACHRFRLSADHKQLTDATGEAGLVRHRCPTSSKR